MADTGTVADMAEQQPDAIRRLEQRAIYAATRPLAQALTDAQAAANTRWIHLSGPGRNTPVGDALRQLVDYVRKLIRDVFAGKGKQAQRATEMAVFNATQLGARQATAIAAVMQQTVPPVAVEPGTDAQQAAETIPAAVEEEHDHALALLTTASLTAMGLAGLNSVFTRARRAVGRIARGMAVAISSAVSHAASLIARALGGDVRLLWVAEPDACAACRAYAGLHIKPGGKFQGGLSLDPKRTVFATAISGPPRHPHCRCVLIAWSPNWPVDGPPLPTLLRQRARNTRRP